MVPLGILLLLAAAALVLWVFFGLNGEANNSIHFDAFGFSTDLTPIILFGLGALTLLLVWAATRLFAAATKKKYRARKDRKAQEKEHARLEKERASLAHDRDEAQAERDRLARERDHEHDSRETAEAKARVWERDARDGELNDGHRDDAHTLADEAPQRGRHSR